MFKEEDRARALRENLMRRKARSRALASSHDLAEERAETPLGSVPADEDGRVGDARHDE